MRRQRWQVSKIARTEGPRGFFAGYDAFLLRDLPFDAIEFATYEALKSFYMGMTKRRRLNAVEAAATGAIAGGFTGARHPSRIRDVSMAYQDS